jgi:dephospho-CoA kinase
MTKSILITGVTGTGKSAICDELKNLGYKAFSIEDIDGLFTMVDKKTGKRFKNYDNDNFEMVKQADWICDKKKLQRLMRKNSDGIVFYNGTASNLDDLLPLFDKIFLLKVSQKILRERLSTRTSNDFARTAEVQKWVFSWKKWWEDRIKEKGAIVIDASRPLREVANDIIERGKSSK